jgi:hypothetical protein
MTTCVYLWGALVASRDKTSRLEYIGHECCILGHRIPCPDDCQDRREKNS